MASPKGYEGGWVPEALGGNSFASGGKGLRVSITAVETRPRLSELCGSSPLRRLRGLARKALATVRRILFTWQVRNLARLLRPLVLQATENTPLIRNGQRFLIIACPLP